jgi:NAD(P)H dehydrogenase (quinone)
LRNFRHRIISQKQSNFGEIRMNVLIVFAHPESKSLSAVLRDEAIAELEAQGHDVRLSDLYRQGWKSEVDHKDFPAMGEGERLLVVSASSAAFKTGTLTADVKAEQEKLLWADTVILMFPLWWFSMPAILKGWVERVFAYGFGYGVGEHSDKRWGDRYGEGVLAGRRAMIVTVAGGWPEHYRPRGVNGPIDDLLFPINHGILYYPGFDILPPFVAYRSDSMDEEGFKQVAQDLRARMRSLSTDAPIPYRKQNGGDYFIPSMELRPEFSPGRTGFGVHLQGDNDETATLAE